MGRPNPIPPKQCTDLTAWVRTFCAKSDSQEVKQILQSNQNRRQLVINEQTEYEFSLKSSTAKIASASQICGRTPPTPCSECQAGGYFNECVVLDGHMSHKCASCYYLRQKCSLEKGKLSTPRQRNVVAPEVARKRPERNDDVYTDDLLVHATKMPRIEDTFTLLTGPDIARDYVVCGTVKLQNPQYCNLSPFHLALIEKWRSALQDFDQRNMGEIKKVIEDMNERYCQFKTAETSIRAQLGPKNQAGSGETFVRPSGELRSPVTHLLHQPSMTSENLVEDAETRDYTNGCIRQILNNGSIGTNAVFVDWLHRRSDKSNGMTAYPKEVLGSHESFTHDILESIESKVVLIYGKAVQKRILASSYFKTVCLPLWGALDGIFLQLFLEGSFKSNQKEQQIRFCALFLTHPQRQFFQPTGISAAILQDTLTEVAVNMTSNAVTSVKGYYAQRKWQSDNLNTRNHNIQKEIKRKLQQEDREWSSLQAKIEEPSMKTTITVPVHHWLFQERSHDVKTLKELLPRAIEAARKSKNEWLDLRDLPDEVTLWLKGSRDSLFAEFDVDSLESIEDIYRNYFSEIDSNKFPCLTQGDDVGRIREALLHLMRAQKAQILSQKTDSRLENAYFIKLDGSGVELKCAKCDSEIPADENPRFSVRRPNYYWIRTRRCRAKGYDCRSLVPKDPYRQKYFIRAEGPGRSSALYYEYESGAGQHLDRDRLLLTPKEHDTQVVDSWCIRCKERTVVGRDNTQVHTDPKPRWTIGTNPYYVEQRPGCKTCLLLKRPSSRFIPVDPTIKSVDGSWLDQVAEMTRGYPPEMCALIVASIPPKPSVHPEDK